MLSTRPRSGKKSLPRVAARHMVSCQQQARPNVGNPRCSPTLPPPALLARCLLALSEPRLRAPFVRPERPFVRTRPSAAPPELGPAHRPDRPTTRGPRAGLEGRWGARRPPPSGRRRRSAPPAAATEPRGDNASCAWAAPELFGAPENWVRGCRAGVLRPRVGARRGRRRGRPATSPHGEV